MSKSLIEAFEIEKSKVEEEILLKYPKKDKYKSSLSRILDDIKVY